MSKHRTVNTHFWDDSYVENLRPNEILLFLFLITNPQTNIAGSYEITLKKIHERTRLPYPKIEEILAKFERDGKFIYKDNWMMAVNALAHQKLETPSIRKGVEDIINRSPEWVKDRVCIVCRELGIEPPLLIVFNSIPSNSIESNVAAPVLDGKPPLREIFVGTLEAELAKRLKIKTLPNKREWHATFDWAFANDFTVDAVLETYDLMKQGFWRDKSVSPKSLAERIPNLDGLRAEIAAGNGKANGSAKPNRPTGRELAAQVEAEEAALIG